MWLKKLFEGTPRTPPPVMTMLLREPVTLDRDMVLAAAERSWNHPFPGGESLWFVMQVIPGLVTVHVDGQQLAVVFFDFFQSDPDEATDELPEIRERNLWPPHKARIQIKYTLTDPVDAAKGRGQIARMVLGLMNENCVGVFDGYSRAFSPVSPESVAELERLTLAAPVVG